MSRWRLLTGTSTGSHTVPPEWCRYGDMYVELHEVLEVGERGVAAAVVEVVGERRAVVGREHGGVAADLHVVLRVAGVLGVRRRRRGLHDLAAHAAREAHAVAVDVGAGVAEALERRRVVADLDADLLEDRVGVVLDDLEPLVAARSRTASACG